MVSGSMEILGHPFQGSGGLIPGNTTTPRPNSEGPGMVIGPSYRRVVSLPIGLNSAEYSGHLIGSPTEKKEVESSGGRATRFAWELRG